ncbi:sugar-binding domain-containing protein [Parapedobacter defluvii]|uniref:glycoside hydrolase family 2 protein n=1 Tax=Parapedobacter defluvii TaxID=2045106 RepID=UPI00334000CE
MKKYVKLGLAVMLIGMSSLGLRADDTPLNGTWELSFFPQPKRPITSPEELAGVVAAQRIAATVPGNVELDLLKAGLIADPMIGSNVYALRKYEGYQWCYTKTFSTPGVKPGERVRLVFGGIDCLAEIWLNGTHIGSASNMFIEHAYDVTDVLKAGGENTLQVIIRSAVIEAQQYMLGTFSVGNFAATESTYIRKAPHAYGWDIMPRLVSAGLWRDVSLEVINEAHIVNTQWMTSSIDLEAKTARVFVDVQLAIPFEKLDRTQARISLSRGGKVVHEEKVRVTSHAFRGIIELQDVAFWWPRGYGDPALYDANVALEDEEGNVLSEAECRVGIRTVHLDRTEHNDMENDYGRFCFVVNGEPVFARGTNWVPLDALHSRDAALLDDAFQLMVEANCNMVRCWGGNVYEDHRFFDLCDENGIMVWQDFAMGCTFYPQRDDFARMIEEEATAVVTKLRNHPSLVLWAGNNEDDVALRWTLINFNIDPNRDRVSREVLPRVIYEMDPTRPFLPSSPYYSQQVYDEGSHDDLLPENHLWGPRGYYKDAYYTQAKARFVSEIGYHGLPNRSTLEKMFTKDAVNPWLDGKVGLWNDEWMTKAVRPFPDEPKQGGRNDLMTNQVKILFGSVPADLDNFIRASQAVQAEAMKFFVEKWRGDKPERSGIIWWNIRDGWPILSDAVTDYYNSKKLAFHFLKNVQENVCVFINDAKAGKHPLVAVNDTRKDSGGYVTVTDIASGKTLYQGDFTVPANGKSVISELPALQGQGMLLIRCEIDGKPYTNHYLYGEPPFNLDTYYELLGKTNIYAIN